MRSYIDLTDLMEAQNLLIINNMGKCERELLFKLAHKKQNTYSKEDVGPDASFLKYLNDIGFCDHICRDRDNLEIILGKKVVIPIFTNDENLARDYDGLKRYMDVPDIERILDFKDKEEFKRRCEEINISMPRNCPSLLIDKDETPQTLRTKLSGLVNRYGGINNSILLRSEEVQKDNRKVSKQGNLEEISREIIETQNSKYVVDEFLNIVNEYNITYFSDGENVYPMTQSKQIIRDFIHSGNIFSEERNHVVENLGRKIANYFVQETMFKGIFGLDFIETDKKEIFPVEANIRLNGNNYSKYFNEVLNITRNNFGCFKVETEAEFDDILRILSGKIYSDVNRNGVLLPYFYGNDKVFFNFFPREENYSDERIINEMEEVRGRLS